MDRMKLLAVVLLVGCGTKAAKPDCERYALKYADTVGADPSRRTTVVDGERRACKAGRVTADQVKCVHAAASESDIRACMGLAADTTSSAPPKPPDPTPMNSTTAPTFHVISAEGGGVRPIEEMPPDQKLWFEEVQRRLGNCAVPAGTPDTAFKVTVTFTADGGKVDVSAAPEQARNCIERKLSGAKPTGTSMVEFEVPITLELSAK
jgi:hypothetical protein